MWLLLPFCATMIQSAEKEKFACNQVERKLLDNICHLEGFNDWGGRGYDDFVPGEVTKIAPSGDETT